MKILKKLAYSILQEEIIEQRIKYLSLKIEKLELEKKVLELEKKVIENKLKEKIIKLKILQEGQNEIQDRMSEYPGLKEYYDMVSKELSCKIEEIVCIDVHPDNEEEDEEGWKIESFFPKETHPEVEIIYNNYCTNDFAVGCVIRIVCDGIVFVAESNASPWCVYGNLNNINQE